MTIQPITSMVFWVHIGCLPAPGVLPMFGLFYLHNTPHQL